MNGNFSLYTCEFFSRIGRRARSYNSAVKGRFFGRGAFKKVFGKRGFLILLVLSVSLPLVIYPDRYVRSVFGGMELYALSVLPALFPFFFFSKILSELNFGYDLGAVLKKPLAKFFKAPPVSGYILVMSMLCGYPIGAKLLCDYYERGCLDRDAVRTIAAFTSTSGPLFVVGTVGVTMLGDKRAGFIILIAHYLSALINGLLFGNLFKKKGKTEIQLVLPTVDYGSLLSTSMTSAVTSVAAVGGYVAVFNMIVDLVSDVGALRVLARGLSVVGLDLRLGEGVLSGLIEVTKGCLLLSTSGAPLSVVAPLCAFGVTFGGLSVTLQSLTYLTKCRLSPGYYFLFKTTQAFVAFGLCKLLFLAFG